MKKSCLLLFILFGIHSLLSGSERITFRHLSIKNGLSNNQIHSIYKDFQGFMWFGTAHGLSRYDGNHVTCFYSDPGDSKSLPGNQILYIGPWINQKIIIETNHGFTLYNPLKECFENEVYTWLEKIGITGSPHLIRLDSKNRIWIAKGSVCYSYDLTHKRLLKEIDLSPRQGNKITDLIEYKNGIAAVTDKGLLVGVYTQKGTRHQLRHLSVNDSPCREIEYHLFADSKDRIWKYSVEGISLYPSGIKSQPIDSQSWFHTQNIAFRQSVHFFPHSMTEDESGRIWVGTDREGIYILDENQKTISQLLNNAHKLHTLVGNSVNTLYKDPQGIIWAGTYKSGVSYHGKPLVKFHEILQGDVTALCKGKENQVWVGTDNGKLFHRLTPDSLVVKVLALPDNTSIVSLLFSKNEDLWIGTSQGHLYKYSQGILSHYGSKENLIHSPIWSIVEDNQGQIWFATLGNGIHCLVPDTDKLLSFQVNHHPAMGNNHISSLCNLHNGLILGGSSTTLFTIDPSKKTIQALESVSDIDFETDGIHQVYEDTQKNIWVASNRGLWAIPPSGTPVLWDINDGLPLDPIHGITEDHKGTLWISTAQCISNIQLPPSGTLLKNTAKLFNYTGEDELVNSDPNLRCLLTSQENEILSGNIRGLTAFNPLQVRWGKQTPKPVFTALHIGGQEIQVGKPFQGRVILPKSLTEMKEIKLRSTQNMFTLFFAPLEYNLPKKPDYYYQLEGIDKSWIMGDLHRQSVSYSGLAPGKYLLKIHYPNAVDPQQSTAELMILIRPPFYLSVWAYIFYFTTILVTGWFFILWLRNKKRMQTIEIRHKRDVQFSDLKQRFFTSVSHDLRTPLTLIITPLEALLEERKEDSVLHARLSIINRNAKHLLHLVNQLLDFKNSERKVLKLHLSYGDMSAFLREITDFFVDYAKEKKISFRIHTEATSYPLLFDKDKLTKAITNLLSNAFKFTPEHGQIVLSLAENKTTGETQIAVIDSGRGIPIKDRPKVFDRFYQINQPESSIRGDGIGLSLVKEFVELHGGSIQISDGYKGTGTCFTITLPASLRSTHAPETTVIPHNEQSPAPNPTNKEKLLIVDDNTDFLDFLSENLSELYTIQKSTNGRNAWNSILKDPPHLIISDVMMPEMDGNDLCRLVKHHRLTSHIPFILLTAKNSEESRIEGLTSGADEYLTKPFNLSLLKLRIYRFLEWSRTQPTSRAPIDPEPEKIEITSTDELFIQNAVKYVESHMDNSELSVNEMGKYLCLSRAQLYKRMTALTGRSPIEFIRIIRIKRAHQLLSCSKQSVAEIAYQVGFNNPKYFSQYFKEEYGISPSDFRKRQAEE